MRRVAFLSCHLSGTGHLVRTLTLARATRTAGADVTVLSGGRPLPHLDTGGVRLVQLPPLVVPDLDFSTLRRPDGTVADAGYMAGRRAAIADALGRVRPDVLVTETFPLGRRMLAHEFESAIADVRRRTPAAAVIASVRDIPEPPRKPERLAEAEARLARDYDLLMVHGDPALVPLSATWPLPAFAQRTRHTGYVAAPAPGGGSGSDPAILVAVGGGVLGRRLLALAAEAAAGSRRRWHLLAGGADAAEVAAELGDGAPENLVVEPARSDYRALLSGAAASVSLAGYNTVLDLAACDTPAVLVPFEEKGEKEQGIRARALAGFPGIRVLAAEGLDAATLRRIAEEAADGPRRLPLPLRLDGAEQSARLILATAHAPMRQT